MKKELKTLAERMIKNGWGKIKKPNYPRPFVADWLYLTHPKLWEEYKEWFDMNVRETKDEA